LCNLKNCCKSCKKLIFRETVSVNNIATVNTNIYFGVRNDASGNRLGTAWDGGACASDVRWKSLFVEWASNDLVATRVSGDKKNIQKIS
jgi:hypothetical protein